MRFLFEPKNGHLQIVQEAAATGEDVQAWIDLSRPQNAKSGDLPPVFQISSGKSAPKSGSS